MTSLPSDINLKVLDTLDLTASINKLRDEADTWRKDAEKHERSRKASWRCYYKIKNDIEAQEAELKKIMDEIAAVTPDRKRKAPECPDAPTRNPFPKLN